MASPAALETASTVDDRERIAQRAYELYISRGRQAGRELEDWLAAERELKVSRASDPGGR
jgi:hypothetical protein